MRLHDIVDLYHEESIQWRHPRKYEIKSGVLIGKKFRFGRSLKSAKTYLHTCLKSDWVSNKSQAFIYYRYGKVESYATLFELPTRKPKTQDEIVSEIINMYPGCDLHVPNVGCSLHGDIDATLTKKDGSKLIIAWNY